MEEARRKLRIFLICVVMTAVLVGMIYYFTDVYGNSDVSEGTLVKAKDQVNWFLESIEEF